MSAWLRSLPKKDLRLLRDWKQFSSDTYGLDWVIPDEEMMDEFLNYLDERFEVTPLEDFIENSDSEDEFNYKSELENIRSLYRDMSY
jgi:hypothetical protein